MCQDIVGTVRNTANDPLANVNVRIVGTSIGTVTDTKGKFKLSPDSKNPVIQFSATGMETLFIQPGNQTDLNIVLKTQTNSLDEVQVIAYGTNTQRNTVGSITKISGEQINAQPITNPLAGLEGLSPGLVVTASSGIPGSSYTVQVRGQNTVNPNLSNLIAPIDQPLFIVDGVPYSPQNGNINQFASVASPGGALTFHDQHGGISPFNGINPSDIESIEVLRDASATAIYGTRGGNGVIIITTKKGKAGKSELNISLTDGESRIGHTIPMMNTQQYLSMRRQAFANDGLTPNNTIYDAAYAPDLTVFDTTRYTDWKKYFLGNTAHNLNLNGSLSGGSNNTQFRLGTGFNRDTYIFPGNYADNRASFSANIHHNSEDKALTVDFSAIYSYEKNNSSSDPSLLTAFILDPDYPAPTDARGNLNWNYKGVPLDGSYAGYNPFSYLKELYTIQNTTLNTNLSIGYKILNGLTFRTSLGYSTYNSHEYSGDPLAAQDPEYSPQATARFGNNNFMTWIIEPQLEYRKASKRSILDVLIGGTLQKNSNYSDEIDGSGYINDNLIGSISGAPTQYATDSYSQYKYIALFGRLDYKLDGKYILDVTGNRDGSSRFGPNKQFGNFGSLGAGWLFNEENFIKDNLSFLTYGKLKGSYGLIGNDQVANYQYIPRWQPSTYNYNGSLGYFPQNISNPDFTWATTKKLEFGLEMGFLKDRLLTGITWYSTRTGDQLISYNLPNQTGFNSVVENENALVQNTGFEITMQYTFVSTNHFSWVSSFNMTIPQSKLLSFPNLATSSYALTYQLGKPLSEIYGFRYADVNPADGLFEFYAANGQKTENPVFKGNKSFNDQVPLGSLDPKFYGGWQNTFTYGNFQLGVMLNYRKQMGINYLGQVYNYIPGNEFNQPLALLNSWKNPGQNAKYQILSSQYGQAATDATYFTQSSGAYSDASFIRFKVITLSYQLPKEIMNKLKIQNLRIYVTAENLFTINGYKGNDPETQNFYGVPELKTVSCGLQLTL
jgi:TonB-linked SusC/RagA family outer membrane protein